MDPAWGGGAEADGAGTVSVGEGSFPEASAAATSCDGVAPGWTAAEDFLSAAVASGATAGVGWSETPGLALPGASLVVAAGAAAIGAGVLAFAVSFEVRAETLLLARSLATANPVSGALAIGASAVLVASDERA